MGRNPPASGKRKEDGASGEEVRVTDRRAV